MGGDRPQRARTARWSAAADLLAQVRREPGATRAQVARRLNLSSGSATEITARLRELQLISEVPAAAAGRGRPTTVLAPHPAGPLVVVAELRQEDWRCAVAALDGTVRVVRAGRHTSREHGAVLDELSRAVREVRRAHGARVRAVSLAVAGTVRDGRLVQSAILGWGEVDLTLLTDGLDVPLLVGNDATLAGVAEARTGAATGAHTALHVLVEVGVGGGLVVGGRPVTGAGGASGEYGHMPFGERDRRCPCGASGCWDLEVDGRGLARHLGEPPPADPRTYAQEILRRAGHDPAAARAARAAAAALGRGIAGLMNAHDPDVVTVGGLAIALRAAAPAAFGDTLSAGLMAFRRTQPPPVLDAVHGDDGALHGAAAVGLDQITTAAALAAWADRG